MDKIAIIGRGNVATHLFKAIGNKAEVVMVNPHTFEALPSEAEVILISVSDDVLNPLIDKLPPTKAIVAHTAGSVPVSIFKEKFKQSGVFYPLQTFSKDMDLDYSQIPVFIEGSTPVAEQKLKEIAALFTTKIYDVDSQSRKQLHLASVFACNFTNAMAGISLELLKDSGLDFSVLMPLLRQTVEKLEKVTPVKAQTGPAVRGDKNVIESHLMMLKDKPELSEIYQIMTDYIQTHKR